MALAALRDVPETLEPNLRDSLDDVDPGIRAGVAHALGARLDYQAVNGLITATQDPYASVRREAVQSLGELDAWQALPRIHQIEMLDPDGTVKQAARSAEDALKADAAGALGVEPSQVLDIEISNDVSNPQFFALTSTDLYEKNGASWQRVSRLPDVPTGFAPGQDNLYLATASSGLYHSPDDGKTWEHLQFGLRTPTQLSVTAVIADPQNVHRLYIALAARGSNGKPSPLGIAVSEDDGYLWSALPDAPANAVTTRLMIDPEQPNFLFGLANGTLWRYALPSAMCDNCLN